MNTESNSAHLPPTFSELLDYAEGRLTGAEHQRVADFIAEHPQEMAAEWAWVQDFLKKSHSVEFHPMPADLEDRLNSLYTAKPAVPPLEKASGWIGNIRQVVAELVNPEGAPDFAAAGLRTKSFENTGHQWAFKTQLCDIWVNTLKRPDQRYDLHGQVFPMTEYSGIKAGSVQLVHEDRELGLTAIDTFGEFLIRGVPTGEYAMVITGEGMEVFCTPVRFGC